MKNTDRIREIIQEVYLEVIKEQAMLKTSSEEILQKFPTLRKALTDLLTKSYPEFINQVIWVSPKPTSFEIKLNNGESFKMKWDGDGFICEISGKSYHIDSVQDYQRALSALGEILQTGPVRSASELEADAEEDLGGDDMFGGGGDDAFAGGDEEPFDAPEEEPEPDFEEL